MAGNIKGITIQIEGKTSGLVNSLKDVETQIKKDDAALKSLDKALKLDPTNVDLLAAKEAVLADKADAAAEKMGILQQVANDAMGDLPEETQLSAAQMAELQAEISNTAQTLDELSGSAGDAGDEVADVSDSFDSVGDSARDAGNEVEESSSSFEGFGEAAETAGDIAVGAFNTVVTAATAVTTAAVAAGAAIGGAFVGVGGQLVDATMSTAGLADELLTLSSVTGLSTDTLQELNYSAELLDVDTSTITGSMTRLVRTMSQAADGSSSAAEKFAELGVSYTNVDGSLRSTEDVFWDSIDALSQIENETERDATAMELFGRSARELNPLIEAGSEAFNQYAQEAHDMGYVLSGDTLDAFSALDDNTQRLHNGVQAIQQSFGQVLLPLLSDLSGDGVSLLTDFSSALASTGGDISQIGSLIEDFAPRVTELVENYVPQIVGIVTNILNALLPAITAIAPQIINTIANMITTIAQSISQNSASFIEAFTALFESVVDSITTILPVLVPIGLNLIETILNAIIDNLPLLVDAAIQIVDTLLTTILSGDNLQKVITGAVQLIVSLAESIINNLPLLVDAAVQIIVALVNGISQSLPTLIPATLNAIFTIVDTLLSGGSLEQILQAGLTLITTLALALVDNLPTLISYLPQIITGIVNFLTGDALPDIVMAGFQLLTGIVGALPDIIVAIIEAQNQLIAGMVDWLLSDGAQNLTSGFLSVFLNIAEAAIGWGADIIDGLVDGIMSGISNITNAASTVASAIADYLHFSVPDKGPLSDFDESGADMIEEFINSMLSKESALQNALNDTAGIIGDEMNSDFSIATNGNITQTVDYSGGLSRIEQAITAKVNSSSANGNGQMIFPIYIGGEHVETLVVDALDNYNYTTGGH